MESFSFSILSYTVGWRVTERRGASAQCKINSVQYGRRRDAKLNRSKKETKEHFDGGRRGEEQ